MAGFLGNQPPKVPLTSADIADGTITNDDLAGSIADGKITGLSASKLTGTIADARVPASAVTQHVTATDLAPVRSDILKLAIHQAIDGNRVAYNLEDSFIDGFEDDTGITTETNVDRDTTSEYVSSIYTTVVSTTPSSASDYTGATGSATIGSGTVEWNAGDVAMRSTNSVSGDFEFTGKLTAGDGNGGWLGAFPVSEVGSLATGHEAGNMHTMTNSFFLAWSSRATITNGTNKGGSVQTSFDPANNDVFKLTRVSAEIKYYVNDVLKTTLTGQTTADMYLFVGSGGASGIDYTNISWVDTTNTSNATGTLISDPQTASTSRTSASGVIIYEDGAGTNTLGTDLKIYFTANNGTNWTEAASYGTATTYSGTKKLVKLGATTVTAGTQVAMKAVWANQSGSKEARLHGWAVNY